MPYSAGHTLMLMPATHDDLLVSSYGFDLAADRIAQTPADRRDDSRLLVVDRRGERIAHRKFSDLPDVLLEGDLVVANDTRVLAARLYGTKEHSGGRVEILALHPLEDGDSWAALVRPSSRVRPGTPKMVRSPWAVPRKS